MTLLPIRQPEPNKSPPILKRSWTVTLRRFLIMLGVALVIILAITVWFFPSNDDFQAENPFWNGTREMSSDFSISPLATLADLPSLPSDSTIILVPYLDFNPDELEGLYNFVTQGGTLVLADDYGYGNRVLEHMELEIRFSGETILDPLFCYKNKWLPRISSFTPSSLTSDTDSLILNHATCLINAESEDVLARSSSFSFLDLNANEVRDEAEPTGPLPVISRHNLSNGQLILISDPSLFINSMDTIEGNYALVQNIAATTTSRLLIDQSHLPPSNLDRTKSLLAATRSFLSNPAGALGLSVVVLTIVLMPVWLKKERNKESLKGGDIDYTE
jgi:hypothetical protein